MKIDGVRILFFFLFCLLAGCSATKLIRTYISPAEVRFQLEQSGKPKIFKIYTKDGGLYVLNEKESFLDGDTIAGTGAYFDYRRNLVKGQLTPRNVLIYPRDFFFIPKTDITLIETNNISGHSGNLTAISIAGVFSAGISLYCLTNPKACFGSCPTFYAIHDGKWELMSEGFSNSIMPVFEKRDIDMLYWANDTSKETSLKLTNEALETHVIRYVDLLAFPQTQGEKVFATQDGIFYRTLGSIEPLNCTAEEGDCTELVKKMDKKERYSEADVKNLSKKEEIIVNFENVPDGEQGLLIGNRQTLLTTYLFYQGLAYAGNNYGDILAGVENGSKYLKKCVLNLWKELGGIEVFYSNYKDRWKKIEVLDEMGPIASDIHLIKLPADHNGKVSIKLRMTKGLWRIDYLALAKVIGEESPLRFKPFAVCKDSIDDPDAIRKLTLGNDPLVTLPGDVYILKYRVPSDCSYQYFLDTKGYYLEWMREEWLKEENLMKLAIAFNFPGWFMKKTAPAFKKAEPQLEKIFWESRYVKQ